MPSLTLSGNEITDAVRAAATSGDGLSPEGSMGVWEATTNLVTNGGFETNTTAWTSTGLNSFARDTTRAKFGSASAKCVGDADGDRASCSISCTSGTAYTYSAWVYLESLTATGLFLRVADNSGAGPNVFTSSVTSTTGSWVRLSVTFTAASTTTHQFQIRQSGAGGVTFYIDGVQVEAQPLATPYVETNGGTASRTAASASFASGTLLDETQGWVALRIRPNFASTLDTGTGNQWFSWLEGSNRIQLYYQAGSGTVVRRGTGSDSYDTVGRVFSSGDTITMIAKWTSTRIYQSYNGSVFNAGNASTTIPTMTTAAYVGCSNSGNEADADIIWFACGTGTLSDADAAAIHAAGNNPTSGVFGSSAQLKVFWPADTAVYSDSFGRKSSLQLLGAG